MTINYTTLLGLAKPVTGTESGAWGDVINDQITSLVEDAIANAVSISVAAGNVTLSDNDGSTDQSRMAILLITGSPGTTRNIVAPSRSKWYIVRNGSDSSVVVKGSATTGVTIAAGKTALVFWNGTDFATVASNNVNLTTDVTGTLPVANGGTGATTLASGQFLKGAGTSQVTTAATVALESEVSGTLPVVNGGTGATSSTGTGSVVLSTSPTLATPILGAASATSVALGAGAEGTPSLTATGDLNTGMWFPAADTLAWSTGGGERVRVDSSGNVGIGTTSPTGGRLHVSQSSGSAIFGSTAGGTGYGGSFENIDAGTTKFVRVAGSGGNGVFSAGVGASTQLLLDTSGNLGLGTSSPGAKLDVYDTGNTTLRLSGSSGGGGDVSQIDFFRIGSNVTSSIKAIRDISNTSGALTFFTALSGVNTERMRLDSSGNLGIGTSSPSAVLHVKSSNGTIISETTAARNSNNNFLSFRDATGEAGYVGYGAGGANFYTWNNLNAALLFGTNNFERMRITSGGVLCVGDSATGDATGAHIKATTITNSNVGVVRIQSAKTSDSADTALSVIKQANDSTTAQVFVRFLADAGAAGSGQINANGANTVAFGTYSDARLKENIVDLPPQLASICALRPVEFDYIQSEGGGHQIGFIAQEMEQVYPDAVGERSDGMKTITAWSKTEARLVKAIQEQQAIIESLIARIAALEVKGA